MADKCMVGTSPKMLQTAGIEFPSTPTHEKISRFLAAPRRVSFLACEIFCDAFCARRAVSPWIKLPFSFFLPSVSPVGQLAIILGLSQIENKTAENRGEACS